MTTEIEILQYLHYNPLSKRAGIAHAVTSGIRDRTLKRIIAEAMSQGNIEVIGKGPATKYRLTPQAQVTMPLRIDTYFEKALLALVLLSYIQAFTDGNKRTARITSNGVLIAHGYYSSLLLILK